MVLQLDHFHLALSIHAYTPRNNQLCGINEYGQGTYTAEGITAIANALRVNGSLTKLSLAKNELKEEGTKAICKALKQNTTLKELDISGRWGVSNIGGPAGVKHVAKMLGVNGSLTALDLSFNYLKDKGVSAVCEAIQSNKETKLSSLNFGDNGIGPVGANAVAAMVAATGSLTSLSLAKNELGDDGAEALLIGLKENKSLTTLDLSGRGFGEGCIGPRGAKALASAISVNGSLTSIDLSSNQLCGLNWEGKGNYTTVGITAIADALRANGSLTKMRYVSPQT